MVFLLGEKGGEGTVVDGSGAGGKLLLLGEKGGEVSLSGKGGTSLSGNGGGMGRSFSGKGGRPGASLGGKAGISFLLTCFAKGKSSYSVTFFRSLLRLCGSTGASPCGGN